MNDETPITNALQKMLMELQETARHRTGVHTEEIRKKFDDYSDKQHRLKWEMNYLEERIKAIEETDNDISRLAVVVAELARDISEIKSGMTK